MSAKSVVKLLIHYIIGFYGVLISIVSDQGMQFVLRITK
jgi:hypothetical protein